MPREHAVGARDGSFDKVIVRLFEDYTSEHAIRYCNTKGQKKLDKSTVLSMVGIFYFTFVYMLYLH